MYRTPTIDTIESIARVLGVSLDWLMSKDADESGPLPEAAPAATGTDNH